MHVIMTLSLFFFFRYYFGFGFFLLHSYGPREIWIKNGAERSNNNRAKWDLTHEQSEMGEFIGCYRRYFVRGEARDEKVGT
jgi:hypothetical protein